MPQDAFTIFHTAKELNTKLSNARIDRINQPTADSIVLYLRTQNKNEMLLISANAENARVTITSCQSNAPLQAPSFCMLLRKHLSHAVIESVEQVPYERIFKIKFNAKNELRESGIKILYAEIMGKYSNIILTENGKILGAIKQSQSLEGLRPILPGVSYNLPMPQDKTDLSDTNSAINKLRNFTCGDFSNYLFNNFKGISKATATEIVFRYFRSTEPDSDIVINSNIEDFYKHFKNFYDECNLKPCVSLSPSNADFYVTEYKSVSAEKKYFESITSAIDYYYTEKETKKEFEAKKRKLSSSVTTFEKKLRKKYQIALDKILACKNMQQDRIFGELIISNLYRIESGKKEVLLENFYSPGSEKVLIPLDDKLSPKENAEKYFKRYNKEKKTVNQVEPQVAAIESDLKYIQSLHDEIDLCGELSDFAEIEEELIQTNILKSNVKKNSKKEQTTHYRVYNFGGFDIFVGKNNLQNTKLTSSAERNDVWLHTKDYHSSHVIIKTNGKTVPDDVLLYAAEICAFYSKARSSDKVPVDYTLKKFVKRPQGLPLGMVYYTDQKTIIVTPNSHI